MIRARAAKEDDYIRLLNHRNILNWGNKKEFCPVIEGTKEKNINSHNTAEADANHFLSLVE